MILAAAMEKVTIPESLGLSLLGMVIVFFVLIFLMAIIYIMTAIIRRASSKPAMAEGSAGLKAEALTVGGQPQAARTAVDSLHKEPSSAATSSTTTVAAGQSTAAKPEEPVAPSVPDAPAIEVFTAKKYKVIVNGSEYEVDAETGEIVPGPAAPAPEAPIEAPVSGAPAIEVFTAKKYRVIVNGSEYEVDAGTGEIIPGSAVPAPEQEQPIEAPVSDAPAIEVFTQKKYRVIVDGVEYKIDAATGDDAAKTESGKEQ